MGRFRVADLWSVGFCIQLVTDLLQIEGQGTQGLSDELLCVVIQLVIRHELRRQLQLPVVFAETPAVRLLIPHPALMLDLREKFKCGAVELGDGVGGIGEDRPQSNG